jgi:hypothetical protein
MSDIKKKLLEEIDNKAKMRKALKERIANNNPIETFVQEFVRDLEDVNRMTANKREWNNLVKKALSSLVTKVKTIDPKFGCDVKWRNEEDQLPQVEGVLIKWSRDYQIKTGCDPELYVDVASLLFK